MKRRLSVLFLLVAQLASGQLIPAESLPVAEPAIPYATTSSSSARDVQRWVWGNWQYQARKKLMAEVESLKAQLAAANTSDLLAKQATLLETKAVVDALAAGAIVSLSPIADLTATMGATDGLLTVTWEYTGTTHTGFRIERSTDGVNYTLIASVGPTTHAYVDRTVSAGRTYWYQIRAYRVGFARESDPSNVAVGIP